MGGELQNQNSNSPILFLTGQSWLGALVKGAELHEEVLEGLEGVWQGAEKVYWVGPWYWENLVAKRMELRLNEDMKSQTWD